MANRITDVEIIPFEVSLENAGTDENGFNIIYQPETVMDRWLFAVRIHTADGEVGEYVNIGGFGNNGPTLAQIRMMTEYLLGKDPLRRERHWSELQRGFRKYDRFGIGTIDIALWDLAGKTYGASISELLGSYRETLPAYASTYMGDENGGLDSPEAYADFAEDCLDLGFLAFKMHGWGPQGTGDRDIDREIATVHALGDRVGDEMDLMLDPACEYETWADALQVGRACDEQSFYWYEDPYRDGGVSQHGHKQLHERLDTPLLQGEYLHSLELNADFIASGATDFARADPEYDGGITGAMKIANVAEGLGLDIEYHGAGPAQRHCMAATRNTNYYELGIVHPRAAGTRDLPVYQDSYQDALTSIDSDGTVPVPTEPGLGVTYDWDYIKEHQIET